MTNDPTQATELTRSMETPGHQHDSSGDDTARPPRPAAKRWTFVISACLVAVGIGGALGLAGGGDSAASSTRVAGNARSATTAAAPAVTTPPSGDPAPSPGDEAGDAAPDPGPPPSPGHLVVSDTHIVLTTNDFDGSFQITNDGGADVAWSWSGNPTLAVVPSGGVLAPGDSVVVAFTITWQQLKNGGFIYWSYVDTDDQSVKVTVTGTRDIAVDPGIELPEPVLTDH